MGLIFDLAVAALALAVVASLALLVWTIAVTLVRAVHLSRREVADLRTRVTDGDARLISASTRASTTLAELSRRTDPLALLGDRSDR